jgi:N-acetylglucosaminyltransferase
MTSVTVVVPAFNEEEGLGDTLDSFLVQTRKPEAVIVVDDCSTDGTADVIASYTSKFSDAGIEFLRICPPENLGSKAKAQNLAIGQVRTDLVLPVDADTLLAPNYVELIVEPFKSDKVNIAAGCVLTRHANTVTERGRQIEYLFGFHWHRPIQAAANSPVVCSGCCSAFRMSALTAFGGFPERTIVEDMDYTWSQQISGKQAVYVADAVAYAADPETVFYLRKQVWRWMSGFFQNVRVHAFELWRKPMLALWIGLALVEILLEPLWWTWPVIGPLFFHQSFTTIVVWFAAAEAFLTVPVLIYGARRRGLNVWRVLANMPYVYVNKAVNGYYAWKAMISELVLVPLHLSKGLVIYEKGR